MKKIFALLLVLCMIFALSACGKSGGTTSSEAPAAESGEFKPDGPVTLIVAYKAGSGTDGPARILAQFAEKYIGQTVVVENVDGGSGSIGWSQLAAADPDGMTIGVMNLPNFNNSIVNELGTYTTASFKAICNVRVFSWHFLPTAPGLSPPCPASITTVFTCPTVFF